MRRESRQWTVAFAAALAGHVLVAVAMFRSPETSGAFGAGAGGLLVGFRGAGPGTGGGPAGSSASEGGATSSSAAAAELAKVDARQTPAPAAAEPLREPPPAVQTATAKPPKPEPVEPEKAKAETVKPDTVRPKTVKPARPEPKKAPTKPADVLAKTPPPPKPSPAPQTDDASARKPSAASVTNRSPTAAGTNASSERPSTTGGRDAAAGDSGGAAGSGIGTGEGSGGGGGSTGGGAPGTKQDYVTLLRAWLEEHKRFPKGAEVRRQQGTVVLFLALDRRGLVLDYRLEKSSGHSLLDREVVDLVERAVPFPPMPDEMAGSRFEMVVPVQFFLR